MRRGRARERLLVQRALGRRRMAGELRAVEALVVIVWVDLDRDARERGVADAAARPRAGQLERFARRDARVLELLPRAADVRDRASDATLRVGAVDSITPRIDQIDAEPRRGRRRGRQEVARALVPHARA